MRAGKTSDCKAFGRTKNKKHQKPYDFSGGVEKRKNGVATLHSHDSSSSRQTARRTIYLYNITSLYVCDYNVTQSCSVCNDGLRIKHHNIYSTVITIILLLLLLYCTVFHTYGRRRRERPEIGERVIAGSPIYII